MLPRLQGTPSRPHRAPTVAPWPAPASLPLHVPFSLSTLQALDLLFFYTTGRRISALHSQSTKTSPDLLTPAKIFSHLKSASWKVRT